ncbi:kinase-like protein [Wilcoxina mikolae CBS 423.85]|nr:kinase-like protein [Wilcoxina mikolae CBS 423.85]
MSLFFLLIEYSQIDLRSAIEIFNNGNTKNDYESYKLHYQPHWEGETEIDHGGFGTVFTANVRRPGMLRHELCALKRISKTNYIFPRHLYEWEIATSARLVKHEWFVQFFGWHEDEHYIYIAMEYMEFGDLERHIKAKWTERDTKVVTTQLLEGLMIMHGDGIIHRDLKPANVFPILLDDSSLRIKIGDFGVSQRICPDGSTVAEAQTGSRGYMAPEVLYPSETRPYYTNSVDL